MEKDIYSVEPPGAAAPGGHYSHGVGYGDLLFVSGQLGIRQDGSHTADCDFEVQARHYGYLIEIDAVAVRRKKETA